MPSDASVRPGPSLFPPMTSITQGILVKVFHRAVALFREWRRPGVDLFVPQKMYTVVLRTCLFCLGSCPIFGGSRYLETKHCIESYILTLLRLQGVSNRGP